MEMTDFTHEARESLRTLLEEVSGFDEFAEDYANHGICFECGELRGECEPDAENYECHECGAHAVMGLELAMITID